MKIEVKNISFSERNSEETNCFAGDLYINGKKVGVCTNSGQGGPTCYHGFTKEDNVLIAEAEKYCKTLPNVRSEELNFEFAQSLENIIDEQVTNYLVAKERKKKERMFEKAICYGVPNGYSYRTVYWKGRTLAQIDKINLQRTYNDIKAKLGKGEVILNTNLAQLGINL
jgi:hypothetical protein